MAKHPSSDQPRKKGKGTSVVVWVLMGMLILGLGGFGVTSFGGGLSAIGRVGDRDIIVADYARALQQELNAFSAQVGQPITLQQAQGFGLDRQVRQRLVDAAALDNETARIGLSAGDARVAKEITAIPGFQGPAGGFDREAYRFTLQRNDMTEATFETRLRDDLARSLLQGAVSGGFVAPESITNTLHAYIAERRGFTLLRLTEADLESDLPPPSEADLNSYYTENIAVFTRPEARRITYVTLLPDQIVQDVAIDETALRDAYNDRISEFVQPERRLVERLVYPDEATAMVAKEKLDSGASFETLVEDRGVRLEDIDLGDVSREELGDAGDAIFGLTEPGVVGPYASALGPALFRMNAILSAQNVSFEEAQTDLRAELAMDAARREIGDLIEDMDDRLAGGATLEDLAKETRMTLEQIDFTEQSDASIAGYPEFRAAANAAKENDFPEIIQLGDGGIFALRLDEIVPPTPIPFEDARTQVEDAWTIAAITKALSDHAVSIKSEIEAGASLGAYGIVDVTSAISRSSTVEATPDTFVSTVFSMEEGQTRVIEVGDFVGVVHLDSIQPANHDGPDSVALKQGLSAQIEQALSQDAFTLFTNAMTQSGGIYLDDSAINAVHAQFR